MQQLDDRSCMNREVHVQFSERLRGRFPWSTCLIRQFFTKGSKFEGITDKIVNSVKNLLNRRPRKTLNYATPQEEFFRNLFGVDCALQG